MVLLNLRTSLITVSQPFDIELTKEPDLRPAASHPAES